MLINRLKIDNFRNLQDVEIEPHRQLNLFTGANGAGKTSILEAALVLAKGHSFRSGRVTDLIGPTATAFQLFAELEADKEHHHRLGLSRDANDWQGRIDGQTVRQLSDYSALLPIIMMDPTSYRLIDGPPDGRRRFLDWGVFHVEPSYLPRWRRYSRALKQRNALLKQSADGVDTDILDGVDHQLVVEGEYIDRVRAVHFELFQAEFTRHYRQIDRQSNTISLSYQRGWAQQAELADVLESNRSRDMLYGVTASGPHKADVHILLNKDKARDRLSRGQQKAVTAALFLAQASLLLTHSQERPVLMLDDLVSEFDQSHQQQVLETCLSMGCQVWITGVLPPSLDHGTQQGPAHKMFHVERGTVQEMV